MTGEQYLTYEDVSRVLNVTTVRVAQLKKAGILRPAIQLGNKFGFTSAEVEELRQARQRVRGNRK